MPFYSIKNPSQIIWGVFTPWIVILYQLQIKEVILEKTSRKLYSGVADGFIHAEKYIGYFQFFI